MRQGVFKKIVLLIAFILLIIGVATSLSYRKTLDKTPKKAGVKNSKVDHPKVEILMKDGKLMILELYPEYAPETVANFIKLAKTGFYDGLKFHRIIKGFMVQGGDPKGNGTGGADKNIKGEFADNGFEKNTLRHVRGIISMARGGEDNNSASSQFFIMDGTQPYLDGKYAAFGKLISGDKTLEGIANTPVVYNSAAKEVSIPVKDVIIKKIIVLAQVKK